MDTRTSVHAEWDVRPPCDLEPTTSPHEDGPLCYEVATWLRIMRDRLSIAVEHGYVELPPLPAEWVAPGGRPVHLAHWVHRAHTLLAHDLNRHLFLNGGGTGEPISPQALDAAADGELRGPMLACISAAIHARHEHLSAQQQPNSRWQLSELLR